MARSQSREMKSHSILVFVALLAMPAGAQILDDPAGDVATTTNPAAPSPASDPADLLALDIAETPDEVTFRLTTAVAEDAARDASNNIYFAWSDSEFRVNIGTGGPEPEACGIYRRAIGGEFWDTSQRVLSTRTGTVTSCTLPREAIRDGVGRFPVTGDVWTHVNVTSEDGATVKRPLSVGPAPGDFTKIMDRMPDTGSGTYTVVTGGESLPPQYLASRSPVRYSNGEATAHIFPVSIINTGEPIELRLNKSEVPDGWQVFVPDEVHVDDIAHISIIAVVPFLHQHGITETFTLEIQDGDRVIHSIPLGVHYFTVAQPAGHHPTLTVHASQSGPPGSNTVRTGLYMNTLSDDERDTGANPEARSLGSEYETTAFNWCIRMEEMLRIGLHQDTNGEGLLEVAIESDTTYTGTLHARVFAVATAGDEEDDRFSSDEYCYRAPAALIAESEPATSFSTGTGATSITLQPRIDILEPSAGRRVWLDVSLELDEPVVSAINARPYWDTGASVTLPLRDYQEGVGDSDAGLVPINAPEARQPGRTALFTWQLVGGEGQYNLQVAGMHSDWVTLLTPSARPGDFVQVSVQVPTDASAQLLRHFVVAQGSSTYLGELTLSVDPQATDEDDAGTVAELDRTKNAPMPAWLAVMGVITMAGRYACRRKHMLAYRCVV